MTKEEFGTIIEEATARGIEKKLGEFYVDRERHWEHHEFINGFINFVNTTKSTAWKTIVRAVVYGGLVLLLIGFAVYVGIKGGIH